MGYAKKDLDFMERFFCPDISVISEITKRMKNKKGLVLYDGACPMCRKAVKLCKLLFSKKAFGYQTLQDSQNILPSERRGHLNEMLFMARDRTITGGGAAWVSMAQRVWWLKPLAWLAWLPGVMALINGLYRYVAKRQTCDAGGCKVQKKSTKTKQQRGLADRDRQFGRS